MVEGIRLVSIRGGFDPRRFSLVAVGGAAALSKLIPIGAVHDNGVPEHDPDHGPNDTMFLRMIQPYKDMKVESREVIKPDEIIKLKQAGDSAVSRLNVRFAAADVFTSVCVTA